jgi:hypothetical protein
MTIFRHIANNKLYIIEHLICDHKHLNNNADAGIYAYSYDHVSETIIFRNKSIEKCEQFVKTNFIKIAEK